MLKCNILLGSRGKKRNKNLFAEVEHSPYEGGWKTGVSIEYYKKLLNSDKEDSLC